MNKEEVARPKALPLKAALLTNIIPPFRRALFQEIGLRCREFRVFISTPMEANRQWQVDWQGLDVQVQKTLTLTRRTGHNASGDERQFVHFPIDTVPALLRYKADAVLSSELGFRTLSAVVYRLLQRKSRLLTWVCVSESTEAQRSEARHQFRRILCRMIDGFLVNGASGERYLRTLGIAEERIFRAPYPTDLTLFAGVEAGRRAEISYRMLYVGQFVARKGLLPFLQVLAKWASEHPYWQGDLMLAGAGPLEDEIRTFPAPMNLTLTVRGFVPYGEMAALYQEAGIFVFPTLADEWGTVASEAMACGLPVLGSVESQAVEELVLEGESGWLFHPGKPEEVYQAIDRCFSTAPEQLARMRMAAKNRAMRLSPEKIAEQVMEAVEASKTK